MNALSFRTININSLSASRFQYQKHSLFREFFMNSLSASRFLFEFTIVFVNSLGIDFFHEINMKSPSESRFHYEFTIYFAFHHEYTIFFANSPSVSRISWNDYDYHYLLRDFTMCTLSFWRLHFQFTILFPLWISLWIHYLFREFPMNSLSDSRFHYEFFIWFAISLWIYFTFLVITVNTLSAWRFCFGFTLFTLFANFLKSLSNYYETTMKSLWFTIFLAISLRIHHFFPEFTVCFANSP